MRSFKRLIFLISTLLLLSAATSSLQWNREIEVAEGRGIKGPWQQNDSKYDYVDDPTVGIGKDEEILVAWVVQNQKDIFFQRFSTDGLKSLSRPINVSTTPDTFSWLPRISVSPSDPSQVYIVWQEIIFSGGSHGGDMLLASSTDGGKTFSEPVNLSQSAGGDGKGRMSKEVWDNGSYDLSVTPEGKVIVVWTEYDGALWMSQSEDKGKKFSRPKQVAGSKAKPVRGPSLAAGEKNTIYLTWTNGENPSADIMLQKSTDGAETFGAPKAVARTSGHSDAPKLAIDSKAVLHLVYAEGPQVVYTRSTDDGKTFKKPIVISTPAPEAVERSAYPHLSIDSRDNIFVLWELYKDPKQQPEGLGISFSRDSGKTFSKPALVPGSMGQKEATNGSHQGLLMEKMIVRGKGNIFIVNSSLKKSDKSRVWLILGKLQM